MTLYSRCKKEDTVRIFEEYPFKQPIPVHQPKFSDPITPVFAKIRSILITSILQYRYKRLLAHRLIFLTESFYSPNSNKHLK